MTKVRAFLPREMAQVRQQVRMSEGEKGQRLARLFPDWYRALVNTFVGRWPEDPGELSSFHGSTFWRLATSDEGRRARQRLGIEEEDLPSFVYFEPLRPHEDVILKNEWLVHFTPDSAGIMERGFARGVSDPSKLGLTTRLPPEAKAKGGFNFAYRANDHRLIQKAARGWHGLRFGDEVVVFQANGVQAWHRTDEQSEVVFWGQSAKNLTQVLELPEHGWSVMSKDGRPIYKTGDSSYTGLEKAIKWVTKNRAQYRGVLRSALTQPSERLQVARALRAAAEVLGSRRG